MRIVVTGGAGFIGSHIADAYVERGHEVFIVDDFSTGREANVNPRCKVHSLDIVSPEIPKLLADIRPDVLNHHAAQMDVRRSVADPMLDARVNIVGLINLVEGCRATGIKKVIFASSGGAIYGEQDLFPAAENHPTRPLSPYGVSKLAGEFYLAYFHAVYGIPYSALRYANVYGPRQSSKGEAGVIAIFISQLLAGKKPIINGDGKQTRDYVYVGDVVEANVQALEASYIGGINIATGRETDVLTLAALLRQGVGSDLDAVHGPAKVGEQKRSCLETSLAAKVLGWQSRMALNEGLKKTIAYYRDSGLS